MKPRIVFPILIFLAGAAGCSRPVPNASADPPLAVAVVHPLHGNAVRSITLPGDLVGFYESSLYAKVTGYLKSISVDKGDWVKKGEVLAQIEVPELQERFARAQANLQVQKLTYQRLEDVWKSDPRLVARQDVDIAQGKYLEAKADVDELGAIVSYTRIVAPFDGIVTARYVDPGALIKAGGDQTTAPTQEGSAQPTGGAVPVVSLAMIDTMRTYVYVPQGVVGFIRRGTPATLTLQDLPGRSFNGAVTRFAESLDLSTRTMLTEIDLNNSNHQLYPGMYANVTLQLERHPDVLQLPDSAIGNDTEGNYIMLVSNNKLIRRRVTAGIRSRHYIEIVGGLNGDEQVVAALDPSLIEGETVNAVPATTVSPEKAEKIASTRVRSKQE
jgi:membrane fusion protein, multidrug efflux system